MDSQAKPAGDGDGWVSTESVHREPLQ